MSEYDAYDNPAHEEAPAEYPVEQHYDVAIGDVIGQPLLEAAHYEPAAYEPAAYEPAYDEPAKYEPTHDEPAKYEPTHDERAQYEAGEYESGYESGNFYASDATDTAVS